MESAESMETGTEQFNGESFVEELRDQLQEIDAMAVGEHAMRFEALHQKLNHALSSIDGL